VDVPDESAAYMEFLNTESQARAALGNIIDDDDDEGLEEETLLETPLDLIEPYQLFRGALLGMWFARAGLRTDWILTVGNIGIQLAQPHVYEALTKNLTPGEKAVITCVFQEAEQKMLEHDVQVAALTIQSNGA